MTAPSIADLPPGLADPVHHAQQVFRLVLDAMSRPGRVVAIDPAVVSPPAGLGAAAAAVLLTVADADVRVWLHPTYDPGTLAAWLRFHTGARVVGSASEADWLVLPAAEADATAWQRAHAGTDEAPHTAATVLVDAPAFGDGPRLTLRGPGIEHTHTLQVEGLGTAFWHHRIAREPDFPRGADLVVTAGHRLAALPRSTRITLED